jgi:hypothetical protein
MPPFTNLPSSFDSRTVVSVVKTHDPAPATGKAACFHRFPPSKFHLIRNFHRAGHVPAVLHGETFADGSDPFDLAPLNHG